jgi:hypothetical protein
MGAAATIKVKPEYLIPNYVDSPWHKNAANDSQTSYALGGM